MCELFSHPLIHTAPCYSEIIKSSILLLLLLSYRCKKWEVPVEKVYNKTQREKFAWAIDMADETFTF